jgi:hypothetical protein
LTERRLRSAAEVGLFEELLPKLKSVRLDGDPRYVEGYFVTGLKSLPIRFELV